MHPILPCLFALAVLSLTSCYEDRVGCLDPDAANYELRADEACPDCCTYPELSIRMIPVWNDTAIVGGDTYEDGAGNTFQLVDFRYYLGDLELLSSTVDLPEPRREVELEEVINGTTGEVILNGNYLLASLQRTTTNVGEIRLGETALTGFSGTYGLPDRYRNIVPATAPTGDALRTQPRRLNYRDGRGYVQARLEYTLAPGRDTVSVSSYGSVPFELTFPEEVFPRRGADIRLDVQADLQKLVGAIDLSADTAAVAEGLTQPVDFLQPVGIAN